MGKKSIRLVEDTESLRILLREFLEMNYYIVYEASGYREGIEHLKNHIDLVITDHSLPDGDGFDMIKAIRNVKPTLPVIMMTGKGDEHVAIKALRCKVADYIKKPLQLAYLKKRLTELLGG